MKANILGFIVIALLVGCKHMAADQETSTAKFGFFKNNNEKFRTKDGAEISLHDYKITPAVDERINKIIASHFGLGELKKEKTYKKAMENGFSETEATSLLLYTGSGAALYSEWLKNRDYKSEDENLTAIEIESLFLGTISALNKLQVSKPISRLYFGQALPEGYFKESFQKGMIWSHGNFTSTSLDREIAEKFATGIKEDSDKKCIFQIENSSLGRKIEEYSFYPEEKEVLFLPMQKFRIGTTSSEMKDGHEFTIINLEELPPKK